MIDTTTNADGIDGGTSQMVFFLVRRVLRVWRELITLAMLVATVVTPADVFSMLLATPPILIGMIVVYALACWRSEVGADN